MNEPLFLTLDEVLRLHEYQIEQFGGDGAILDIGRLEAAIAQPSARWEGKLLHEDLASMAAAYLYHIVQNHPFADGNKRTGAHAAIAFLTMNGVDVDYPTEETEAIILRVARGEAGKDEVIVFFRALLSAT